MSALLANHMPEVATAGWATLFWAGFEHSKNPMALLDQNRRVVAINPALTAAYGYGHEESVGRHGDLFLTATDWKRAEADWADVLQRRRTLHIRDLVRTDRRQVRVQAAAYPEYVTGRHLVLFVVLDEQLKPLRGATETAGTQTLTPRELEIVAEVAMGRRAHEIADDLVIATTTVQTHVRNAMAKLGARSQAQLVAIALTEGLLSADAVNPGNRKKTG